jgi:hypothetical protein
VATVSLTDQTSAESKIPLITAATDGLYRVTFYLESSRVKGSVWGVSFNWTDDLKTWNTPNFEALGGTVYASSLNFRVLAGQPIAYTVTKGNSQTGTSYSLFVTVEQLQ